ncbi:MAG TPA: hypothetical protein VM802_01615 [Chitinophaga sp.]|uniref:hypothetical protein n=1 Tax=Chitinophaga sp. TaxID=1869181 RepID=UPI002CD9B703|nr:hypothetical protein [Chitinophaga sp.]HVI43529.1 hypothetical protein [Chitinophaga sp.]
MTYLRKNRLLPLVLGAGLFLATGLVSCNTATPENVFDRAVLNTNLLADFGENYAKMLESYTVAYTNVPNSQKRGNEAQEQVKMKVQVLEKALKDIQALPDNDDAKELKATSIALFEGAIPVYKKEYAEYAKLCDTKGPEEQKLAVLKSIEEYSVKLEGQYAKLMELGKVYAEKHHIQATFGR